MHNSPTSAVELPILHLALMGNCTGSGPKIYGKHKALPMPSKAPHLMIPMLATIWPRLDFEFKKP
jgi:hypothetical protein